MSDIVECLEGLDPLESSSSDDVEEVLSKKYKNSLKTKKKKKYTPISMDDFAKQSKDLHSQTTVEKKIYNLYLELEEYSEEHILPLFDNITSDCLLYLLYPNFPR